jgi:tryptophan-rich sensory protein
MTTGAIEGMAQGARSSYLSAASVHRSPAATTARIPSDAPTDNRGGAATRRGLRSALVLLAFIGIAALVAAFGSLVSASAIDGWYADTAKPMWNPPNAVFGPVWAVLYVTMSVAAWLVWRSVDSDARSRALRMYVAQLALNAVWTPAFFGLGALMGAPGVWIALVVIVTLDFVILSTIIRFADVSKVAAGLLFPYWFWALFATTLNAAIAVLAR